MKNTWLAFQISTSLVMLAFITAGQAKWAWVPALLSGYCAGRAAASEPKAEAS